MIGIDGIDDAMKAVADGEMEMTVYQDPNLQAEALYNALAETRDGNMPTEDINVEVITVTAENVADYTSYGAPKTKESCRCAGSSPAITGGIYMFHGIEFDPGYNRLALDLSLSFRRK